MEKTSTLIETQKIRAKIRKLLEQNGFLEVDIPPLLPSESLLYGGIPVEGCHLHGYLASVMTPYIRRWLVIGQQMGIMHVYHIGRCFRDEPVDQDHYPVFENLALGSIDHDYHWLMDIIESLVKGVATNNLVSCCWQRVPYWTLDPQSEFSDQGYNEEKALDEYDMLSGQLEAPTFLTELPRQFFGPARLIREDRKERAELFIQGSELGNFSTFLTDPDDLAAWYQDHIVNHNLPSIEQEHLEAVRSLRGRMMTTGALGLSRLYKILTGADSVSDTVAFPL